jgi:hypothetical protein
VINDTTAMATRTRQVDGLTVRYADTGVGQRPGKIGPYRDEGMKSEQRERKKSP